jgi:tuberculosinol/isotuberculosinol synthase
MRKVNLSEFQNLPTSEVARLVRETGPKVCVFPINGTRRWFMLEYPEEAAAADLGDAYLRITWQRQIEIYKMFFEHGVDTLLTPIFGPDLLSRGDEYVGLVMPGLLWCAQNQDILDFYEAYDVRVRVYGDTRRYLQNTPYARVLDAYEDLARRTAAHRGHRLFFGVCAHDASETVAEIGVHFYQEHGRLPTRCEIVEAYYGEYVEPVSFFIGFDRFTAFDMPLVATGNEDLYFTVSPSPYLDARGLRAILYDHLYTRRVDETNYAGVSPESWKTLADFYALNRQHVLGLGGRYLSGNFWYPLPQVEIPPQMAKDNDRPE